MKKLKKLLALVLALAICAAFALPALASETETTGYTLTMNNPQPGHEYAIYQLLQGSVLPGGTNIPEGTLGNISWGESCLNGVEGYSDAAEYAKYLGGLSAGELDDEITGIIGELDSYDVEPVFDKENNTLTWSNLPGGYYVVVDATKDESSINASNPLSNVMVQVVGDTTITPKAESLIPDKGVKEADDLEAEYEKIINSEVGKVLEYNVTATVSVGTMNLYDVYLVRLTDTMSKGHTYVKDSATITITDDDGKKITITDEMPPVKVGEPAEDGKIILTIDEFDLKALIGDNAPTIGNVIVTLKYQAIVNKDAIEFNVVNNEVTWDTKPNDGDDWQKGTTITTETYIYNLSGEKVSGGDNEPLSGAEFVLTREDGSEVVIYKIADGEYFAWNGNDDNKPEGDPVPDNIIVSNGGTNGNTFVVKGLAEGTYTLTETKTPDGYNTMEALTIKIVPVLDDDGKPTGKCVYHYEKKVDEAGNAIVDEEGNEIYKDSSTVIVVNNKGTTLPSTGGIGTTIFYIVGAVLVVGAGVLLFTKRRVKG